MWLFDSKLSIWWLPRKEHIKVQVQPGARDGIGISEEVEAKTVAYRIAEPRKEESSMYSCVRRYIEVGYCTGVSGEYVCFYLSIRDSTRDLIPCSRSTVVVKKVRTYSSQQQPSSPFTTHLLMMRGGQWLDASIAAGVGLGGIAFKSYAFHEASVSCHAVDPRIDNRMAGTIEVCSQILRRNS
jgi:hypothetical protein